VISDHVVTIDLSSRWISFAYGLRRLGPRYSVGCGAMTASDRDLVKVNLLIEGLQDYISLGEVHGDFFGQDAAHAPPIPQVQKQTLDMIRELVGEGLFVLGVPTRRGDFSAWDLPLDVAMLKIEDAYVKNFDDRWSWTTMAWMSQTEKGKKLALELYHSDDSEHFDEPTP
jgi:hypothetical protein